MAKDMDFYRDGHYRDRILPRRAYEADTVLFRQGDVADAAYIVERGVVTIHQTDGAGKVVDLGKRGPGALIGEMAVIDGAPRMATAIVAEHSTLVRIPADQMRAKMDVADPFLLAVIRILMDNLREANRSYSKHREPENLTDHVAVLRGVLGSLKSKGGAVVGDAAGKVSQCVTILDEVIAAMERRIDRK